MSKAKQQFVIVRDGEEKTFDDEGAWRDMQQLLDENDVDYDAHGPTESDGGKPKMNGQNRQSSMMEQQDKIEEQSENTEDTEEEAQEPDVVEEPEVVEPEPEPVEDSLPDRQLTDDPIEWMQEGSGEFTTNIKGTTVITKKGFRVLQHKYDISTGSEVIVGPEETDQEFCRVKAYAEMPDGRRAEAHASAHVDRGDDHFLLVSMADTRAKSRALSDVTGVGAVAIEEMAGVDPE